MIKEKFFKTYANLPEPEREQIIAIINERTYSWNVAFSEIRNNTKLGKEILNKIKNMGLL